MDKSLDEIIKSRFNGKGKPKPGPKNNNKGILKKPNFKKNVPKKPFQSNVQQKPKPVADARNRIIQKQRSNISDARVILTKKQRQHHKAEVVVQRRGKQQGRRQKPVVLSDEVEDEDEEMYDVEALSRAPPAAVLRRTVKNNYVQPPAPMPPLPTFGRVDRTISDPFDCYTPYERPAYIPTAPPPPKISDVYDLHYGPEKSPRKGILRVRDGHAPASAALKSRLYSTPDPHQPSGIFGRDRDPDKDDVGGYRIVVSNLHESVTQSDIQELFEDVGELVEARLVRPGVAEVVFKRFQDAEMAVETYHNRQLDSQPMKCLLVKPRVSNKPTARAARTSNMARDLEVDMDALHKVLFRR